MANSMIDYKSESIWIGDWWISICAFFFLDCIDNGNYDNKLEPIKDQIVDSLKNDTYGFVAGSLDLGSEIIVKHSLIRPYINSLEFLKQRITLEGDFISIEKCKQIDKLNVDPYPENEIEEVSTKELIEKLDEIIKLFEN